MRNSRKNCRIETKVIDGTSNLGSFPTVFCYENELPLVFSMIAKKVRETIRMKKCGIVHINTYVNDIRIGYNLFDKTLSENLPSKSW